MTFIGYIVHTELGGEYVGITNDLPRRLREHRAKGPLKGAVLSVSEERSFSEREAASLWEVEQIAARGGPDKLLNTSFGGFGGRRRVVTQAERDHLSRLAKDRQSPQEFRDKMSEACAAAWADPERRRAMSKRIKAKCANPETKARRSEAQKKLWEDPTVRERRIAGIKANRNDPEKAKARTEAALKMWETRRKKTA